jgi:hypothetical protein
MPNGEDRKESSIAMSFHSIFAIRHSPFRASGAEKLADARRDGPYRSYRFNGARRFKPSNPDATAV